MTDPSIGDRFTRWAVAEPSIQMLVLIGSHSRVANDAAAADEYSDWDFQIVTTRPEMFADARWTEALQPSALHYIFRAGRLGSARKATALFPDGELDLVVLAAPAFRGLAQLVNEHNYTSNPNAVSALTDLAAVLQGGYRMLKGADEFGDLYRFVAAEISPARLSDREICLLADGFVCDYVSTLRKIARGERMAAQRWLHLNLAEVNFRLLHELRQREGSISFPDGRRLEQFADPRLAAMEIEATLDVASLGSAVKKTSATMRELTFALVGATWNWPSGLPVGE